MALTVAAPVGGRTHALADVPDPVFQQQLLGPGIALMPAITAERTTVASPVRGQISSVRHHAIVVDAGNGIHVLTHLGVDTFKAGEQLFQLHVHAGQKVTVGQPLVDWDLKETRKLDLEPWVTVTVLGTDPATPVNVERLTDVNKTVTTGQALLAVTSG